MSTEHPTPTAKPLMTPAAHPSFLALDRAALGSAPPAVVRHVDGCVACRGHVDAMRCAPPLPGWLPDPAVERTGRRWCRPAVGLAIALAGIVLLFAVLGPTPRPPEPTYVGLKGPGRVVVFVREGPDVRVWRRERLSRQASIRLGVQLGARTHVAVYSVAGDSDRATLLFAGWLEAGAPALIDRAWRLDDAPGPERLHIVLGTIDAPPRSSAHALRLLGMHPMIRIERVDLLKESDR